MKKFVVFLILAGCIVAGQWYFRKGKVDGELKDAALVNTVDSYYQFVATHKTSPQCAEAAGRASLLVERGEGMGDWPKLLTALGENNSGRPVAILAKYLHYPIAEIRASAAASLLKLSGAVPSEVKRELGDLNVVVLAGRDDSDPRVRRDARCILWQLGSADLLDDAKEFSPFVLDGVESYKTNNISNKR